MHDFRLCVPPSPSAATDAAAAADAVAAAAMFGGSGGGGGAAGGCSVAPAVIVQVIRPGVVLTHTLEQLTAEALPTSATEVLLGVGIFTGHISNFVGTNSNFRQSSRKFGDS